MEALNTLLKHGGFATYLILGSAFVLVIVGIERLIVLYVRLAFNVRALLESVRSHILDKKYTEAIQLCNSRQNSPEVQVVKAGLVAVENGREAMKSAIGGAVLDISHKCEARLGYIALIANVATLLGLLGTISGLMQTFASIANADTAEKAKLLGIGISEAMYATATGLVVGITAMVIHTMCVSKADSIIGTAQDIGLKLITWIEQSERVKHDR